VFPGNAPENGSGVAVTVGVASSRSPALQTVDNQTAPVVVSLLLLGFRLE
jgi:hypothetical protein